MAEGFVSLKDSLAKLEAASVRLNESSDSLNDLIVSLEERLGDLNVGIRLWDDAIFDQTDQEPEHGKKSLIEGYAIGYEKLGDQWRVAFKRVRHWEEVDRYGYEVATQIDVSDVQPLLNAPRHVRMMAAGRFEALIENLASTATKYADSVENAKAVFGDGARPTRDELLNRLVDSGSKVELTATPQSKK